MSYPKTELSTLRTPNARLTRLQSPKALVHPRHRIEYRVAALTEVVLRTAFIIEESGALCSMPKSASSGRFDLDVLCDHSCMGPDPETGYAFSLKCRKPHRAPVFDR